MFLNNVSTAMKIIKKTLKRRTSLREGINIDEASSMANTDYIKITEFQN